MPPSLNPSSEQCDLSASCADTRMLFASVGGAARAFAVDASFLYMAVNTVALDGGSKGFVGRAPQADGSKIEILARASAELRALAVDASHVYWAENDGRVWRVKK